MKILFVRHGETDWNIEKRAQGRKDIELNQNGVMQALEVKERLKDVKIDKIFASPLKRAMKTAEIINENHSLEIISEQALIERNFGPLEGHQFHGNQWFECWNYDLNTQYDMNGECVREFFKRVHLFLDKLLKEDKYETVLLVSHGGVSMAVDSYFNGIVHGEELPDLKMKNCDVREYIADTKEKY